MKRRSLLFLAATAFFVAATSGCESCKDKPTIEGPGTAAPAATLVQDAGMLNVATVPDKEVKAMVNPDNLPMYAGPTGSIEGVVKVSGPPAPPSPLPMAVFKDCPAGVDEYGVRFRSGEMPEAGDTRWLADAIVVVTGYKGFWVREKNDGVLAEIDGCGLRHRTVTMTFGQRLEVKNLTNEFWTPMLDPKSPGAMMMAPPHNTDPVRLYPKQAGRHAIVDHDRKYFINDLMVFRHPLHAVSDMNTGHYRIDGVPVGKLRVSATHPEIEAVASSVEAEVKAGEVTTVNLTLNYAGEPKPKDGGAGDALPPYPGLH
jgi:hypothetical protein